MNKRLWVIGLVLFLNILNLMTLYSAVQGGMHPDVFVKQILWIIVGWLVAFALSFVNHRAYFDFSLIMYFVSILLLLFVETVGKHAMGAQRWLTIFGFSFQPSEVAKLGALLIMARTFAQRGGDDFGRPVRGGFIDSIVLPFLPVSVLFLLIFLQPDLGTALVLVFMYGLMLLVNGIRMRHLLIVGSLAAACVPLGWFVLKDYQKMRVRVFLNPEMDPLGAGYTIIQSKIAIGSGQLFGKGFLSSTQSQFNFLPSRHTDFIFSIFAEEWGFVGCIVLLLCFIAILKIILDTALYVRDKFSANLCVGIFSLFFIHIFINIAMVMGLLPVVGLPLLFFSYGGSYMLLNFICIGIFLSILRETTW